ncbi:MAG: class I SAM-dependent methyltransferase [Candidatus Eremiobacterota bacterium]
MSYGKEVQKANKEFYDIAANIYEEADGRRKDFPLWLEDIIKKLALETKGERLIDFGSGSGWIAKVALKYFKHVIAVDISDVILRKIDGHLYKVNSTLEELPFKSESVDVITCFAVLHHINDFKPVFHETFRILRKNGIFYSDHDLSKEFMDRFYIPMKIYRKITNPEGRYLKMDKRLTEELYKKSEIHSEGIASSDVSSLLTEAGFHKVDYNYHWLGLNGLTDFLFGYQGHKGVKCSWAPLLSVTAIKT